ncbi:MAG: hypothetical protein D3909_09390 [Candidatus Electrothrix sp. ATG1]|nr:hypothetical protein [Candidatus Electrothrix sp. ATG1]MCI5208397.1 hypothetical protein [Candidatus Electrothrix sp. ATG2]
MIFFLLDKTVQFRITRQQKKDANHAGKKALKYFKMTWQEIKLLHRHPDSWAKEPHEEKIKDALSVIFR